MKQNSLCIFLIIVAFLCLGNISVTAQSLDKPIPADDPNIPDNNPWTSACASNGFNDFYIKFTWSPPLVNSDNSFILELSDPNGSFDNPTELATDNTKNANFDFDFKFSLPTNTRSDGYKFRVRSTSPAIIGEESDAYSMFYIDHNSPILISPNGNGTIPSGGTIMICDGNSVTIAPHNIPNGDTYEYNWYRSSSLLSEKGASLTITEAGMYYVEVDYGINCSSSANTLSNTIEVTIGASLGIAINSPTKTDLCAGETQNLEANITGQGLTYVWYKDGTAITTPTVDDDTYTVDASVVGFEGDYSVEISGTGTCLERSSTVSMTNAGNFTVTRSNTANIILLPSQTETLSITTSATTPQYQWYRNNAQISGATNNTVDITQDGVYYAAVTLSGGACASTTINSETTTVVSPASFEIITDYASTYAACTNANMVLEVTTINAIDGNGDKTNVTTELLSNFTYQWTRDGNNVSGATNSSISLTDISDNGDYILTGTLSTYNATTNSLPLQLLVNETLTITSNGTVTCNTTDQISINTTTDLSTASFQWYKDDVSISTTNESIEVTTAGVYRLEILRNGCPLRSNEITISPLDESIITLDSPERVVFPEGTSKAVRASGGTSYSWYDSNNNLLGNTDSQSFTQEGDYILIVNVGNCEVSRNLIVEYLESFSVPNVITVNGDGINDLWVLPNSYSNDSDIIVTIYNEKGTEILNEANYQNNWPASSTAFAKQNEVFYYKIKNADEVLKQGTITVIR